MKKEIYLPSSVDQLELHVLWMIPDNKKPKGIIQFCHGMSEHKERYEAVMRKFCHKGYICVIHDHRGHGKSIQKESDLGYFYDTTGNAIVEDTHLVSQWIKGKYKSLPLHLFGHSMGSLVVRCYLKKYDDVIDSLIVCGSPSKNQAAGIAVGLAKIFCFGNRKYKKGKIFHTMAIAAYEKMIPGENAWISFNQENVDAYNENPLDGFMFTNNGFLNLFYLMKRTYSLRGWKVKNPDLPILFIAGEYDPCIVSKEKYKEAVDFMKKVGYKSIYARLFTNRRHEILNEENPEEVYEVIEAFIEKRGEKIE
ncbi:MAG: alpha/beta hydrolase [Anaerostipes sp.]|nr:alpha/beta hydrolase [Anaerostipes sp.]